MSTNEPSQTTEASQDTTNTGRSWKMIAAATFSGLLIGIFAAWATYSLHGRL